MKVRVLRSAIEDLATAREFYDRQQACVGDYFFDSLFAEIDSLTLYAGVHAQKYGFHRLLARIIGDEAVIFRILDCRRRPGLISESLKG
jgi:hypothetical protein